MLLFTKASRELIQLIKSALYLLKAIAMLLESNRLAQNQKALLETLADPVLLVHGDGLVEYMNPSARAFFPESVNPAGRRAIQRRLRTILASQAQAEDPVGLAPVVIDQQSFSCHIGRFVGYRGDNLHWLILRSQFGVNRSLPVLQSDHAVEPVMLGGSNELRQLQSQAIQVGPIDATVLITGESGTGKELVAQLVHRHSGRGAKPLLTLNCTTFNDDLLANELFGHEKGAFTGASALTKGKFETADGGSLFLDEIGDISPKMQSALLRVLESGEIVRVGGNIPIRVDVRVIAATAVDLPQAVRENRFRLDLYYRLNTLRLIVPPLRDRPEDIVELAEHFFSLYGRIFKRAVQFNPEVLRAKLESYDWPGNVRELQNVVQRAVLMNRTGVIANEDLLLDGNSLQTQRNSVKSALLSSAGEAGLKEIVDQIEREVILQKLAKHGGNVADTAQVLNISKAALYDKMRRHGISAKALR